MRLWQIAQDFLYLITGVAFVAFTTLFALCVLLFFFLVVVSAIVVVFNTFF